MKDSQSNNVVMFPVENRRLDLSNIATDVEDMMEKVRLMKKAYFSEAADVILDDCMRSIGCLDLEETKLETFPLESQDHILIREAIIAAMCRIVGMEHPLHGIMEENLVQEAEDSDFDQYFTYRFKSPEEVTKDREKSEV